MIEYIEIRNFTAINNLSLDFSPRINVIIGENGTGKTHLLKAAYGLCPTTSLVADKSNNMDDFAAALTARLLRIFMPLDDKPGKMHRQGAEEQAYLAARFGQGQHIAVTFFNNSRVLAIKDSSNYEQYQADAVFIPTKEVISFMKGFNSLYERYGLSFDQTYQDICLLLDLPEIRQESLNEISKWAMAEIESLCGGRFIFHGSGKITFKADNIEYSANSIAEGFRKAGILSRLLETGAIQPGISGPLFWDEPEANLNPKLMKLFVQILFELARNGQQIILATHDYVLLKWFDLLMDADKGDQVRFHVFYRDLESGEIKADSTDDYRQIEDNPIVEAFNQLTIAQAGSYLKENLGG